VLYGWLPLLHNRMIYTRRIVQPEAGGLSPCLQVGDRSPYPPGSNAYVIVCLSARFIKICFRLLADQQLPVLLLAYRDLRLPFQSTSQVPSRSPVVGHVEERSRDGDRKPADVRRWRARMKALICIRRRRCRVACA